MASSGVASDVDRQIIIVRDYTVPREQLYKAWTEPAYLWWFFNPDITPKDEPVIIDVRPGGVWRQRVMLDYDPKNDYLTGGVYKTVEPSSRLVFTWGAEGGTPKLEENIEAEVKFEDSESGSRMTFSVRLPDDWNVDVVKGTRLGWEMALDRFRPAAA
ncbi:Bet v1-like protein [Exidia glandulosa HHB12029]|uniref:Bet v1-like protein n=1 Tax=Exidia glandulosa HHB12029 TaxID=1314781 RepID=A0A165MC46_EXIGL|nr:Bet v1-like protein [Exidia glandulosa HHB12029]